MPPPASPISRLIADDLACERGERLLFQGLSFTVAAGSALVITGPNGAGKTSLLRILAGLASAQAGSVRIEGATKDTTLAEQVHFLGSRDGLKAPMTPREHCTHWQAFYGKVHVAPEGDDILVRLHLERQADVPAGALSSGQRRRLALGRLLLAPRGIWLLDEPMNALDPDMRENFMRKAMEEHLKAGGILIASTHIPLVLSTDVQALSFASDGSHILDGATA